MADRLYDTDFVAWSEQQAALLRRHLAGERVNGLDWENIVEEIEGLGRSETKQVASLLTQAMIHRLKIERWPSHPAQGQWWNEAVTLLAEARKRYLRSMAKDLSVAELFADAREVVLRQEHTTAPEAIPEATPLDLPSIMNPHADLRDVLDAMVERLPRA